MQTSWEVIEKKMKLGSKVWVVSHWRMTCEHLMLYVICYETACIGASASVQYRFKWLSL